VLNFIQKQKEMPNSKPRKKGDHGYRRLKRGSGMRLQVGVIESVDEENNTITVSAKGEKVTMNPTEKILFVEPHFKIPKDLRK